MARPLRITFPGTFYHVTSRGNERKAVFKSNSDRKKYLDYLATVTERYNVVNLNRIYWINRLLINKKYTSALSKVLTIAISFL